MRNFLIFVCFCFVTLPALAGDAPKVEGTVLPNGLTVMVVENHRAPVVSHMLWFRVGAADEAPGVSGVAHYLEHMFFKGTPNISEAEYLDAIERRGGEHNAFTSQDFTGYYITFAKEHLEEAMRLESDRMMHLSPPAESYAKERDVILEERGSRIENNPGQLLAEKMDRLLYGKHPYHIPTIGWRDEMERLDEAAVMGFYRSHYVPNNAVLLLVGDVTLAEVLPLVQCYYADWLPGEVLARPWIGEAVDFDSGEVTHADANVRQRLWVRSYPAPSLRYGVRADVAPLMLAAEVLAEGKASVLYKRLVEDQELAVSVSASYNPFVLGPGEFSVTVVPAEGVSLAALGRAYEKEVERFLAAPPDEAARARVASSLKAATIFARDGIDGLAYIFGMLTMLGEDARFFADWPELIESVDVQSMQRAAQAVLQQKAVTGYLRPLKVGAE